MNATTSPAKAALHQALIAAFNAQDGDVEAAAGALTTVLCAVADVVRGPAPEVIAAELVADETPGLVLKELRKHTDLLDLIGSELAVLNARADRADQHSAIRIPLNPVPSSDLSGLSG